MSDGVISTGTCIAFSAAHPATHDVAGFAALTYTASGEVTNYGELGETMEVAKFTTVCDGQVNKRPGPTDSGAMNLEMAFVRGNPAQSILETARSGRAKVSVKLTYPTGDKDYFEAYVTSAKRKIGGSTDLLSLNAVLEIDGTIVED